MVRLLEAEIEQGAMLLERLRPGLMLVDEVSDDEKATRIAAGVMQAYWMPAPSEPVFPTLADWGDGFQRIHNFFKDRACPLPPKTIQRTQAWLADLLASSGEQVLLHGDLHHFNILSVQADVQAANQTEPSWLAIDPFGVVGEREVDVGGFMRNPYLEPPITPAMQRMLLRRFDLFQECLGLDRQRMIAWSAVYAAISAWWTLSDEADGWQLDAALTDWFADLV
jgi:streptomycin 6-kinase